MLSRTASLLFRPIRKLVGLERDGRVIWSLFAVDAGLLGLWLYALNRCLIHRDLDADDYSTVAMVTVLAQAACLGYGLRPGRPAWRWILKVLLGQALAAAVLHLIFAGLAMDLSAREVVKLSASFAPWLLLVRLGYLAARRVLPAAPLECVRWTLMPAAVAFLYGPRLLTSGGILSGDGYWYCLMLGDFTSQLRAGVFPVFVGQSLLAFNGAVSPLRFAPALQCLAGLVDLATGRSLSFHLLQNLTLWTAALGGMISAYFCAAAILPRRRWIALLLAAAYAACPGALALAYQGDLFMSLTTLPVVPLAIYGLWRTLRDPAAPVAWTALPVAAAWYCHPPIALWLTLVAILVEIAAGIPRWRDPGLYRRWARGLGLFLLAGGYTFVSVSTLRLPRATSSLDVILESIRNAFPGMFLPLVDNPEALGNYQLGWTLFGAAAFAALVWATRPRKSRACCSSAWPACSSCCCRFRESTPPRGGRCRKCFATSPTIGRWSAST